MMSLILLFAEISGFWSKKKKSSREECMMISNCLQFDLILKDKQLYFGKKSLRDEKIHYPEYKQVRKKLIHPQKH